eukprot:scaffold12559_cov125-Isochrysis_galbana.AAC.10
MMCWAEPSRSAERDGKEKGEEAEPIRGHSKDRPCSRLGLQDLNGQRASNVVHIVEPRECRAL